MKTLDQLIVESLGCKPEEVTDSTTFRDLGADSLDEVQLSIEIEDVFDVSIEDQEAAQCKTVGDVRSLLAVKTVNKADSTYEQTLSRLRAGNLTAAEAARQFAASADDVNPLKSSRKPGLSPTMGEPYTGQGQAVGDPYKEFAASAEGGPGRHSVKKSHRAEGRNFID